jgi:phosphate-selective porin OprO/OprP
MHGGFSRWFTATLAAATISVSGTYVWGQDGQPWQPSPEPAAGIEQPTEYMASTTSLNADGPVDLSRRVAELERALKVMDEKAAADKKKASSKFTTVPGGRIQLDAAVFDQNAASKAQVGDVQNGLEFRRARIFVGGEGFEIMDYMIEMDFASLTRPAFKDVYFTIKELPYLQNLRIGHFKEPFGLEELTSDNSTTFMERSLSDDGAIIPGRNVGAMAFGYTEDLMTSWAGGAFVSQIGEDPPIYQNDEASCAWTMRATRLLWYDDASDGRGLFHTGLDYSFRTYADDLPRVWRSRPEAHLAPYLVNLSLPTDNEQLFAAEAAFLYGPFSVQAEWFGDFVNGQGAQPNHTFHGGYMYISYFLTGEHRPYDRQKGVFGRMKPFTNFFRVRTFDGDVATGWGAWEIGYRCSYFDALDSSLMHTNGAGEVLDHTFGVNWYLNPYTRFMFNYVMSDADRVTGGNLIRDGHLNTLEMRAQIDF